MFLVAILYLSFLERYTYIYNDVSNQKDANNFLNQPYMFRSTNSPILRSTF